MAKNKKIKKEGGGLFKKIKDIRSAIHPETEKSILAVIFIGIAAILILASFHNAGPAGESIFNILTRLFGLGYYLFPTIFMIMAGAFLSGQEQSNKGFSMTFFGATLFIMSGLGLIDIIYPDKGGMVGRWFGAVENPFGYTAAIVIMATLIIVALLLTLNLPIRLFVKREEESEEPKIIIRNPEFFPSGAPAEKIKEEKPKENKKEEKEIEAKITELKIENPKAFYTPKKSALNESAMAGKSYTPPPLNLLKSTIEKPTAGDLRANANIIKRTLDSFGIPVEMGEITIGPKITRYTLKPAEGIKLTRITALNQDLSLALAAHPIRMEAPIPGKSLVGIEVPNKSAAIVRLGSLMAYPEFTNSGPLAFIIGRDVSGEPIVGDIDKMPHLLIAGSTGSGKTCGADTYIFSENGMLTFKELDPLPLNSQKNFQIKIATRDGIETTSKNYNNGICDFYKLTTEEGYSIEVTAEHPLWLLDKDGKMKWRAGSTMQIGDYVAIARESKIFGSKTLLDFQPSKNKTNKAKIIKIPNQITSELGLFLGLLAADGGLTIKNRIVYTQADKHLLNLYKNLLKKLFGITAPIINKSGQSNKAKDIIIHSVQLKEFLHYLGMDAIKAPLKEIPGLIRMAKPEVIKAFLHGLMRNDGHISKNSIELCLASEKLVRQVQLMLLNFGIIGSVKTKKVKVYPDRTYWRLSVYGEELVKYAETIGFLTKEEKNKVKHILVLKRNPNKNIIPNISAVLKNLKLSYRNTFAKITNNGWQYQNKILIPKYAFASLTSYNDGDRNPSYYALSKILEFYRPLAQLSEYQQLEEINNKNFYWSKISTITKTKGEGYDFEVPGSNSFIGNGFVNHNSVAIHSLIVSLLYKNSPNTLRFILIDPKRVELTYYNNIPHLITPVITEGRKALGVFRWAIDEMERRYEKLQSASSRDIGSFNKSYPNDAMHYIVIIVDELADLMAAYGRDIESSIVRLAQMARATGIHLVLSTQRPSVEVITGLIKANITSRMALQVASQVDSRTILDMAGAEKLLGGGDMLFISSELSKPKRIQGAYISEDEMKKVADFIKENNPSPLEDQKTDSPFSFNNEKGQSPNGEGVDFDLYDKNEEDDELFDEAVQIVKEAKKASASLLQRRLAVGYARAARLLDIMENRGIVGPGDGAKPREVYADEFRNNPEETTDN